MIKFSFSLLLLSATLLVACKPENPSLTGRQQHLDPIKYDGPRQHKVELPKPPPPPAPLERFVQGDNLNTQYNPKVDVVFVMDTSDSMYCDQDRISKTMDRFTSAFFQGPGRTLDFRFAVVSTWDSITYGSAARAFANGQFRPVCANRNAAGECTDQVSGFPFVTRSTPNVTKTLAATLKIGIEPFDKTKPSTSGPQHEELFSPVISALTPEMNAANGNFFRADANRVYIFVTDTDDLTPDNNGTACLDNRNLGPDKEDLCLKTDEMAAFLKSHETKDRFVAVYAVLARFNDLQKAQAVKRPTAEHKGGSDMRNCVKNPVDPLIRPAGEGPYRMTNFLAQARGSGFDLMDSNYANQLAALGNSIVEKSLRKTIKLDHRPDIAQKDPIIVRYGKDQIIPKDDKKGWSYNPDTNELIIQPSLNLKFDENAKLSIEYYTERKK